MFPEVSKALSGHCEAGEEETLAHFGISMPCVPCWAAPGLADWLAVMVGFPQQAPAGPGIQFTLGVCVCVCTYVFICERTLTESVHVETDPRCRTAFYDHLITPYCSF